VPIILRIPWPISGEAALATYYAMAFGSGPSSTLKAIVEETGQVWTWGDNTYGALGTGNQLPFYRFSPVQVTGAHSFVQVAHGQRHTLALKENGECWGWGYNRLAGSEGGQIGDDTTTHRSSPVKVVGEHSFVQVAAGTYHSTALKANGEAWCWGVNYWSDLNDIGGRLGDDTVIHRSSPVKVVGEHSFTQIAAGYRHTAGLKANGEIWCWGSNQLDMGFSGQLGDGTTENRSSPVKVIGEHNFTQILTFHDTTLALKANGEVWGWGLGVNGELGTGSIVSQSSPVKVVGDHSFIQVVGVGDHVAALKANGEIWCWGSGEYGGLGNESTAFVSSPVKVVGEHSFIQVAGGDHASYGLKSSGEVWSWGFKWMLGNNEDPNTHVWYLVAVKGNHQATQLTVAGATSGIRKSDGNIWMWGRNNYGQLGQGDKTDVSSPVKVIGDHSFIQISSGYYTTAGLKENGELWMWGYNTYGPLGTGDTVSTSSPVKVIGEHNFVETALSGSTYNASFGRKATGEVWSWGDGHYGILGIESTAHVSSPVKVVGEHSFIQVTAANRTAIGLKETGEAWVWGYNYYGKLGVGDAEDRSSPVKVIGDHSFMSVVSAASFTFGLKGNGEIWSWGQNASGRLGVGDLINRSSPVKVIGDHSFIQVCAHYAGGFGLKDNGEVWGWGGNSNGTLIDYPATISSPVKISGSNTFKSLASYMGEAASCNLMIKSDDTLMGSGADNKGCLAPDRVVAVDCSSPVKVVRTFTIS